MPCYKNRIYDVLSTHAISSLASLTIDPCISNVRSLTMINVGWVKPRKRRTQQNHRFDGSALLYRMYECRERRDAQERPRPILRDNMRDRTLLLHLSIVSMIVAATWAATVYGQERATKPGLVVLEDFDCLPVPTFGLSGIRLRQTESGVLRKLGKPKSTTKSWGEDDGGGYDLITYHYATLSVDIVRGKVDRIHTKSLNQRTPEGIRVGDSREVVVKKLGFVPRDWKRVELRISVVSCPENTKDGQLFQDDYVTYQFTQDGHLETVSYEVNRP